MSRVTQPLNLRAGDWVEVAGPAEIYASLDETGALDGLPFMPEMLPFCGQRFQVRTRCERSCDPTSDVFMLRVKDTVHLDNLRCNGQCHGGCQLLCLFFWKEAWLKRSSPGRERVTLTVSAGDADRRADVNPARDREWLESRMRLTGNGAETLYRCQATELKKAGTPLQWWKPGQYIRDLRLKQMGPSRLLLLFVYMAISKFRRLLTGKGFPNVSGTLEKTPSEKLDLRKGDWVVVKSREEIIATLDKTGRNRGLTFEASMFRYCGNRYRVLCQVERVINERTGNLRQMREPAVILEDVVCNSDYGGVCSRSNYLFWREIWLRRADPTGSISHCQNPCPANVTVGA
jgi:hypothetical protein